MNRPSLTLIVILTLTVLTGAGVYLAFRGGQPASAAAAEKEHAQHPAENGGHADQDHAVHADETSPGHPDEGHDGEHAEAGHDHGDEHDHGGVSDLDRPVEEMWTARCEHAIPQYQCDECRYEIGVVKLDGALAGEGGLVRTGYPEKRQSRHEERSLSGEVQLDETRTVHVASPLTGIITRGYTVSGAQVQAGAPLFEVDSPEVAEAKGAYLKARAGLELAVKAAEREAHLFERKVAAQVEVEAAEARRVEAEVEMAAARGRLQRLGLTPEEITTLSAGKGAAALDGLVTVRAARPGIVIEGHASPGEYAETGRELLTISDLERVWVMADLKESDLAAAGSAFGGEARIEALGRNFPGRLDTITGRMSEVTRTAKARFTVDNSEGLLRPGMFVTVRLLLPTGGETLAVPKAAVLADEDRTFVFIHQEGDYWVRRPVTLGARFDSMVEVLTGLREEQRIVTDGSFLLKSDVLRGKMGAGCAD